MNNKIKNIAILGSTGSIGRQALEVVQSHPNNFKVSVLTARKNVTTLIQQCLEFRPEKALIVEAENYETLKAGLAGTGIEVMAGESDLAKVVQLDEIDTVLTATVGYSGLLPTINAIKSGKNIALANKETLVVAGELITDLAKKYGSDIYPVDSEHSAIFQCLIGESDQAIEKIILTASGGPFRGKTRDFLQKVTKTQALRHPNWSMGDKITIDSASLMNKGLEVIEAKWLFGLERNQIDVIIHPQSIIHSMVQFTDSSIKAQMGLPDMRLPIQYALGFPERLASNFPRFNFADYPNLSFEQPDIQNFRNLRLAYRAMEKAGNMPCILNAANEIAVAEFLNNKIGFLEMPEIVENCMHNITYITHPEYDDYVNTDYETRIKALEFIS